ncbi:glycosyltransferase [archaeon]|jgi:glycosyltransferase involved in cell wall biosynthesis|nr:glycosyltransferase [archaeon]
MKRISLVIPAYNEEKLIKKTLIKLHNFIKKDDLKWEILMVNDGSTDNLLKVLEEFKPRFFKIVSYKKNKGKGFAIKKAMNYASEDFIGFIDSDLAYSFENLKKALSKLETADICIGSRSLTKESNEQTSILRKFLGKGFNILSKIILGHHLGDTQCGLKVFKKDVAKDLFSNQTLQGFSFDTEILYIAKKRKYLIKTIDATVLKEHLDKKSKVNLFLDPIKMFLDLIKIKLNDIQGKYERDTFKF